MDKSGSTPWGGRLPSGGGAVEGIGSDFATNLNTGTGTYAVPLPLPTGYRGQAPQLALQYSSGAGADAFGLGWSLGTLELRRDDRDGTPSYGDSDGLLLNGEPLVDLGGGVFRPRVDPSMQRVRRSGAGWEVTDRAGTRFLLGLGEAAQVRRPADGAVLAWLVERVEDTSANTTTYTYRRDGERLYLERIEYAVYRFEVEYEARPDPRTVRRGGFAQRTALRAKRLALHRPALTSSLIRAYDLTYTQDPVAGHSLLAEVALTGYLPGGAGEPDQVEQAPPLRFGYAPFEPDKRTIHTLTAPGHDGPPAPSSSTVEVVDLEGFGLPGLLEATPTRHRYWANRGDGTWAPPTRVRDFPQGVGLADQRVLLTDVDGDARADLVISDRAVTGWYPGQAGRAWGARQGSRRGPAVDVRDPRVRVVDATGDGRADVVQATDRALLLVAGGDGWDADPSVTPRRRDDPTFPDVSYEDPRVRLADMSGSGMVDVVRLWAGAIEVWPGVGPLRWDTRVVLPLPGDRPERFDPRRCHLADVNGDGLTDVVYLGEDAIHVWVNRGESMAPAVTLPYPTPTALQSVRAADMLGTGTAGLLFGVSTRPGVRDPYRYLDLTGGVKPYLLTTVDNGVGKITTITYGSSAAHRRRDRDLGTDWDTFLPRAIQVVDAVEHLDMVTGRSARTTYRYFRGHYDARSQRFAGFGTVEATEEYGEGTAPVATLSWYHLGITDPATPPEVPGVPAARAVALRGQLFRRETRSPDSSPDAARPYLVEATAWGVAVAATGVDGTEVLMPLPRARRSERWERSDAAAVDTVELEHDRFGNVVLERRTGQAPGMPDLATDTVASYAGDPDRWILGLLTRKTRRDADGTLLEDVRLYYDGRPFGEVGDGLLSRRERLAFGQSQVDSVFAGVTLPDLAALGYRSSSGPDGQQWWCDEYVADHDARGNVVTVQDGQRPALTVAYDGDGLQPVSATNPLGHVARAEYHPRLDAITAYVEPNGSRTAFHYSPLGRVVAEQHPGDLAPSVRFEYRIPAAGSPHATVMSRAREGHPDRRSVTYYDGLGRELQTRARCDDGTYFVAARARTDLRGLAVHSYPAFVSPSESFDLTEGLDPGRAATATYDALRRTLSTMDAAGNSGRVVIAPTQVTFYDALDNDPSSPFADTPRLQDVDAWGRLVAVRERTSATAAVVTRYDYDARGLLVGVTDALGPLLAQTHDVAGRLLRVYHRDAGVRRFLRDAAGRLVLYVDGAGRRVEWAYDALGRTIAVSVEGAVVERYSYDTGEGTNLVGRLAQVADELGHQSWSYDARGRVVRSSRTVTGHPASFVVQYGYDSDGRTTTVGHPDGGQTTYTFDALGRVTAVSDLITAVSYDDEGRRTRAVFAGGEVETRSYEPLTGRLHEHAVLDAGGATLLRQTLAYDAVGNVLGVDDPGAPVRYGYDALNRLVRAQGGPVDAPYDHQFGYDAIGNLVRNDAWRPDPVSYTGARLTGAGADGFGYDANGCLSTRPGMTLEFDARELLRRVRRADGMVVEFGYDYRAQRLRKRVTDATGTRETLYIGQTYEVDPQGHTVRHLSDPDGGVVLVVRDGVPLRTLFQDRTGSVVAVRPAGGSVTPVRYTAFGGAVGQSTVDLGDLLFAGRRFDVETGLYYLRMRYYDPVLGRFISPDPIAVTDAGAGRLRPLSLNPYVYALDNPQRFSDPNGLWTFWEGVLTVLVVAAVVVLTAVTFGGAGVLALAIGAAVGGLVGGLTTGSVDGAIAGAMVGFGVVGTVLTGAYLGAFTAGVWGSVMSGVTVTSAVLQAATLVPATRQNSGYRELLGYASWFNPWALPGNVAGALVFIANAILYGGAYVFTWGKPGDWAITDVEFDHGMVVMTGGAIKTDRANTIGNFITLNPHDTALNNPTDRDLILRHERGHALNNAVFGVFQLGRLGAPASISGQANSFWEQLAESNVNPYDPSITGSDKDYNREQGGRGFGDIPWWTPQK